MVSRERGPASARPAGGFQEVDHSGDVGIEAWGATRAEVLANATRGLLGLMAWSRAASRETGLTRRIAVRAGGAPELLVDWFSAVILSAATHAEVYGDVVVEHADETSATGELRGAPFDPAVHELRFDVKGATYHGLVFEQTERGFHARVIFDL
jgi:SHS2 domain-containing protein